MAGVREKLKAVLQKLHEEKKGVALLAMLKMDDVTDRWSIVYSAPGLENDEKRRKEFFHVVNILIKNLSKEEADSIARVGVFPLHNHLIESLMKYRAGYEIKSSTRINGNMVHEGYILESRDPRATG